jgi:hypothetical protein
MAAIKTTSHGSSQEDDEDDDDDDEAVQEPLLPLLHEQGTSCHTQLTTTTTTTTSNSTIHDDYILLSDNDENDDNHHHHRHDENDHHDHHNHYPHCQLEPRRFAVLSVFSMNNLIASAVWITFAPIETIVCAQFHQFITTNQVNWLSMIFMAVYGPGTALCTWSTQTYGLERVVYVSSWIMTLGCFLRWYSIYYLISTTTTITTTVTGTTSSRSELQDEADDDEENRVKQFQWAYLLLLTGQGLVAMGQPVFSNAPARVAAAWFQQTAQALGVTVFAGNVGMALGQAMSPLWVVVQDQQQQQQQAQDQQEESTTGLQSLGTLLAGQAVAMVLCTLGTVYYFQLYYHHHNQSWNRNNNMPWNNKTSNHKVAAAVRQQPPHPLLLLLLLLFGMIFGNSVQMVLT